MTKKCKNCGTELPESASFCPHCTQSQIDRTEVKPPRLWRKKTLYILLSLLLLRRDDLRRGGRSLLFHRRAGVFG